MDEQKKERKNIREELGINSDGYDRSYARNVTYDVDELIKERRSKLAGEVKTSQKTKHEQTAEIVLREYSAATSLSEEKKLLKGERVKKDKQPPASSEFKVSIPRDLLYESAREDKSEEIQSKIVDFKRQAETYEEDLHAGGKREPKRRKTELEKNAERFILNIEDIDYKKDILPSKAAKIEGSREKVRETENGENKDKRVNVQNAINAEHPLDLIDDPDRSRAYLRNAEARSRVGVILSFLVFLMTFGFAEFCGKGTGFLRIFSPAENYFAYGAANIVLVLLAVLASGAVFISGVKSAASLKITYEGIFALASVLVLLSSVVYLGAGGGEQTVYCTIFSLCAFIFTLRNHSHNKKLRNDYKFLVSKVKKATTVFEMAEEGIGLNSAGLRNCSSQPTKNYFACSEIASGGVFSKILFFGLPVFYVVSVLASNYLGLGAARGFSMSALIACSCIVPAVAMTETFVFSRVAKKLIARGAVIVGRETVKKAASIDEVTLSDTDLFSRSNVALCGIKVYGDGRIDEIIVNTASVFSHLDGPLSSVLLGVIDNRTELLKQVDQIEFIDGKGIKAFLGDTVIVIGTKKFMKENFMKVEEDGIVEKLARQGKNPLYVAGNGQIAALLSLKYDADESILDAVRQLTKLGVSIKIKSDDPIITAELVAEKYCTAAQVEIVPKKGETKEAAVPTIVCAAGKTDGFIKALSSCVKLSTLYGINYLIAILNVVFSLAFVFVMIASGSFVGATNISVLLLQLLWAVPMFLISFFATVKA